ncbi:hypothetical protein OAG86_01465 [Akkermansiaceae bacterium]|nr:hypothetical protein [Akkermansiaceae bacterium]
MKPDCRKIIGPAELVLLLLDELTRLEISWVYLRGYEQLPEAISNDVDLLIPTGRVSEVADLLAESALQSGWQQLYRAKFVPLAQYFVNLESGDVLHLDLFERLYWKFVPYCDEKIVLQRRHWNGLVNIPSEADENFINVMTRLLYHGVIRDKHREVASRLDECAEVFVEHLGPRGRELYDVLASHSWLPEPSHQKSARSICIMRALSSAPGALLGGVWRLVDRVVCKVLSPPGRLVVFEGVDWAGKAAVMDNVTPWCAEWCAGREPYRFVRTPRCWVENAAGSESANDLSPSSSRGEITSLLFLGIYFLGSWWDCFFRIRPKMARSHVVVGDGYGLNFFLRPARFRLTLSDRLLRLVSMWTPKPDVIVALITDPKVIREKNSELSVEEITEYQEKLSAICERMPGARIVRTDLDPENLERSVKRLIFDALLKRE